MGLEGLGVWGQGLGCKLLFRVHGLGQFVLGPLFGATCAYHNLRDHHHRTHRKTPKKAKLNSAP